MPEKQYFVKRSGKIRGPFDTKKIKELVSTQNVLPSDAISTSEKGSMASRSACLRIEFKK